MKDIILTHRHLSIILIALLLIAGGELLIIKHLQAPNFKAPVMPANCTDVGCFSANNPQSPPETTSSTEASLIERSERYVNDQFGFSILIPTQLHPSTCEGKSTGTGRVVVFEDGNSIYFAPNAYYDWSINDPNDYQKGITCHYIQSTAQIVKDSILENRQSFIWNRLWYHFGWEMVVDNQIYNRHDLLAFIQAYYGSTCDIDAIVETLHVGTLDVKIFGDDSDQFAGISTCPLNFIYALKYSPEKHTAVTWKVGQDGRFDDLDRQMIDSFRFE